MRNVAVLYGEEWLWRAYGNLLAGVRWPAFEKTHALSYYEFLERNPDAARVFQGAMSSFTETEAHAILAAYDFESVRRIVDVGAG